VCALSRALVVHLQTVAAPQLQPWVGRILPASISSAWLLSAATPPVFSGVLAYVSAAALAAAVARGREKAGEPFARLLAPAGVAP